MKNSYMPVKMCFEECHVAVDNGSHVELRVCSKNSSLVLGTLSQPARTLELVHTHSWPTIIRI